MFFVFCTRFCIAKIVKRDFFGIAIIGKYITFCDCDMLTSKTLLILAAFQIKNFYFWVKLTDSVWNVWETMMNPLSTTNPFSTDTAGINLSSQSVAYLYSVPYLSTNHLCPSFPSTFHNSLLPLWLIHHKNKIIWIPQLKRE